MVTNEEIRIFYVFKGMITETVRNVNSTLNQNRHLR